MGEWENGGMGEPGRSSHSPIPPFSHSPIRLLALAALFLLASAAPAAGPGGRAERVQHLIILYLENWSFDGLFGRLPGADGIANAGRAARQVDREGRPYDRLPQPMLSEGGKPPVPDRRFPADLPPGPFDLAPF